MTSWLSGPAGPWIALAAMTVVTYLCRVSGVVLMSRVRITPRIERGLKALPGSIVIATILPLGVQGGAPAVAGLGLALVAMALTRHEIAALAAGLAAVAGTRALGL